MRFLVTGGAGFIGSSLTRRLLRDCPGATIRILDNLHRGRDTFDGAPRVEFLRGDIRDRGTVRAAMHGVDVVYHLAAQSSVVGAALDIDYSFTTNVVGTFEILSAAHESRVQRVIFTSSREVYGSADRLPVPESALVKPANAYGADKAAGELYCRVFQPKMDVVVLRLSNVYGPCDAQRVIPLFLTNACEGRPLVIYGQNKILDFVWIDDVVSALAAVRSAPVGGRPINIGSGQGTTLTALAKEILALTQSTSPVEYAAARSIEVDRYVADICVAKELLGYCPSVGLAHLPDVVEHFLRQAPGSDVIPWTQERSGAQPLSGASKKGIGG